MMMPYSLRTHPLDKLSIHPLDVLPTHPLDTLPANPRDIIHPLHILLTLLTHY